MSTDAARRDKPIALSLLSSERPREVGWLQAAGLLFGDWGTSRLYVLGLAFFFAGRSSFALICAMSLLILAVGWAYSQICRIYPDGGGVYTAARKKSKLLAMIGALLLFADYTVTASLSALDGFHYFGLPLHKVAQVDATSPDAVKKVEDAGNQLRVFEERREAKAQKANGTAEATPTESLLAWDSPGLWAIVSIVVIGLFNLLGPKHSSGFALAAAIGMVVITLIIVCGAFAVPGKINWHELPNRLGNLHQPPSEMWVAFVSIVLALSGVEAIANLTGVMHKPVSVTASKAIWLVAAEVCVFNIILAICMANVFPLGYDQHKEDMLAYLSKFYLGPWGESCVRVIGGILLLSATNTAINGLMSIVYVVSRDSELPAIFQKVNRFGAPWVAAILAVTVPIIILIISHDLEHLAALYAIGVIGAVSINVTLCATHPRLRGLKRKVPMMILGVVLLSIWVTLAFTKLHALIFVCIVLAVGLSARQFTKWIGTRKGEKPSLLRQAIAEQLTAEALGQRKILLGTYGSDQLAVTALQQAKAAGHVLVVCFIRNLNLSLGFDQERLNIDTDLAALRTFSKILDIAHDLGVTVIPVYDTGSDAAELMAETAAMMNCEKILIGTSRQGALYHLIKGHFQQRLESLLPDDIKVQAISPQEAAQIEHDNPPPKNSGKRRDQAVAANN